MRYVVNDSLTYSQIPEGYSICRFTKFKRFKCGDYMLVVDPIIKSSFFNVPAKKSERLTNWYNVDGRKEVDHLSEKLKEKFIDKMRRTYLKLGALL
jgi:hypothetical protein